MVESTTANAGYDDFFDAVEAGSSYYLACDRGHGWLPPRRVCPECGSLDLVETPLPSSGEVATYTTVHVATPQLAADAPYVTAIARFGPVRITAFLRGIDSEAVEVGLPVALSVESTETTGDRCLVVRPT